MVCVPRLELAAHYREPPKRACALWGTPHPPLCAIGAGAVFGHNFMFFLCKKSRSGMNARFIPLLLVCVSRLETYRAHARFEKAFAFSAISA